MAAGMSSRFGKLKQVEPLGEHGETMIDFTVRDALQAGFGRVVFVIRTGIEGAFRETIGRRWERQACVRYVYQSTDQLPAGLSNPGDRVRPWGTGHAVLAAERELHGPFGVVNADDFYGRDSYRMLISHLRHSRPDEYVLVAFRLCETLSDFGPVTRAVCSCDENGYLRSIDESGRIFKDGEDVVRVMADGSRTSLSGNELVALNMWGFSPSIFPRLRREFGAFLKNEQFSPESEFFISTCIQNSLVRGEIRVKVVPSAEAGFGINYPRDKTRVAQRIQRDHVAITTPRQ
jgi:hypothetical protein